MLSTAVRRLSASFVCVSLMPIAGWCLYAQAGPQDVHHRSKPADAEELAAITERGRAIAAYDVAAWHATDEVQALRPAKGEVAMYLGRQTKDGWIVAFGRLSDAKDGFLLAYQADPSGNPLHPRVTVNTPAFEDRGEWLNEARAYDKARSALGQQTRAYNGTILAGPDASWYVYFYPAQTTNDSFPIGADTRFRVSHDGLTILEVHRMHASLLENKLPPAGTKTEMTFHTAILDDAPEDMDIASVLMMGGIPMLIACPTFTYQIQADGSVISLGTTKEFLKHARK